nr:hypothetical protein [Kibdelosporangium sp. MJ126-NF4]
MRSSSGREHVFTPGIIEHMFELATIMRERLRTGLRQWSNFT